MYKFKLQHTSHDQNDTKQELPLRTESIPLSELRYFTHDFANQGMGHKFSELMMGLYFAKKNGLQYVFNEKSFVHNFRHADLQWFADLMKERYPTPQELLRDSNDGQGFEMKLEQWIPVYHYRSTTADAYGRMSDFELRRPLLGFGGRNAYFCTEDESGDDSTNCFKLAFSFFNATRDIHDLLQPTMNGQSNVEQEDRLAIHIRLGDIQVSESPETYVKVIEGMRRQLSIALPVDKIHFVYYRPSFLSLGSWKRLWDLKRAMPDAQYHNIKSTEETVLFLTGSKYFMTSGSSLSYLAAYLCPRCHVISTVPKELTSQFEENYTNNFYYMDEWIPYIRYLSPRSTT
ncbi:hypothetical protein BGX28_010204 [Mortierella sp. GBA30]|nr:hypothetical protein BGX28_010204 [Mortierella sp. GBA30]